MDFRDEGTYAIDDDTVADGPFGGLTPSEAGKKGSKVRWAREREAQKPFDPAEVDQLGPEFKAELANAAFGKGVWKDLPADKRLSALIKLNEYVNGRPRTAEAKDAEPMDQEGFSVGVG